MSAALVSEVREGLARLADPDRAPGMQAYMKSSVPFRGVPAPAVRSLCRDVIPRHELEGRDAWEATVRELYDGAAFREERHAALRLVEHPAYRHLLTADVLPLREDTDLDLLTAAVEASAGSREFFLRKGIGWALRSYARTDPAWVQRFVATHELSPLSRREALKHVGAG